MSSSVESIESLPASRSRMLADDRGALVQAVLGEGALTISSPYFVVDLLGDGRVEPLRLAGLRAELLLRLAELDDLLLREVERLEQRRLGHLVRARLDHRQAVLRADDDQVELARPPASPGASG